MFSGKDAANPAYPTQWALNPTAYQNMDSSQVDWAALAQQWIAMKEAAAIVSPPPPPSIKPDIEEGEAPMEVESTDNNTDGPVLTSGSDWNASPNSWGGTWNQWGWPWPATGPVDPKVTTDPSLAMPPLMDEYTVPTDGTTLMPSYTTGAVPAPTFQHGYWTAPQAEQSDSRGSSRSRDRRSKSKNRDSKSGRTQRPPRDKGPVIAPVIEPIVMSTITPTPTIDAAKRRQLPAWIREGLEKMEREKQKALEREQEQKAREEAEKEKKRIEEEELERLKSEAGGQPMLPPKSKFDTDSEGEDSDREQPKSVHGSKEIKSDPEDVPETDESKEERPVLAIKSKEEIMQEVMLTVRRSLTEILLEVTDQEIHTVSQEELARYNAAQASRLNAMKASKSKALAAIATGLGLGAYESSSEASDYEDEHDDLSDHQLQEIIRRKRLEFERMSRDIEAEVRRAERETASPSPALRATPHAAPATPDPPHDRAHGSSATPPPLDSDTPEKITERRISKEKRNDLNSSDKTEAFKKVETIPEEKPKKSKRGERTPSPRVKSNNKASSSSTSTNSDDDLSSNSSKSSSESEKEVIIESKRVKKRKRKTSSSSDSRKKSKKQKKEKSHKSDDKDAHSKSKHYDDYDKTDKSRSKKRDDYYDRHKASRSRDYERSHKDKYRDDSDENRSRKRSRRSRSASYESRSGRRKASQDRSEERPRRREKRSYERERDRSYDRSGRDYDKYDKYERYREYDRRRSRSGSHYRHRR